MYSRCVGAEARDCDRTVEGYDGGDELSEGGIDSEISSLQSGADSDPLILGHRTCRSGGKSRGQRGINSAK